MATPELFHEENSENKDLKDLKSKIVNKGEIKKEEDSSSELELKKEKDEDLSKKNLDKVDEDKLSAFKLKTEYLQQFWWDEYRQIVNDVMSQFDRDIKKILDKTDEEKPKEVEIELTSKTDEQLENEANEAISQQSKKFERQKAMINKIYEKWSAEDIKLLNDCINKYMEEVDKEYQAFISKEAKE